MALYAICLFLFSSATHTHTRLRFLFSLFFSISAPPSPSYTARTIQSNDNNDNNSIEQINQTELFSARFYGLWRNYKMPMKMPKSTYLRLRGAYLGYNSFDYAMEYRPDAHWGKDNKT